MSKGTFSSASRRFGGRHAVVIGGSMAGMAASRALASHFERVTLIERDRLPEKPELRKGLPQEQQAHGILAKAVEILEGYFPGLWQQMVTAGSNVLDMSDVALYRGGVWQARATPGLTLYIQTRTLLDSVIRSRVREIPNLQILDECEVVKPVVTSNRVAVWGVELRRRKQEATELLEADLVVDASGRGSRMPRWLEELGLSRVAETHVRIDVGYASRKVRKLPGVTTNWKTLSIFPSAPRETRLGALAPVEGDTWLVTLAGALGDHAPGDEADFLEFARRLPQPHVYEMLRRCEPVSPVAAHKFPSSMRRHYERMTGIPEGLVVLGDAVCSLNPIYGQGMTLSVLAASLLDECLSEQPSRGMVGLGRRFQAKLSRMHDMPWTMGAGSDLVYPSVDGPRPLWWKAMQGASGHLESLAAYDPVVTTAFAKVMHMTGSPLELAHPSMLLRMVRGPQGQGPGEAPVMQFPETSASNAVASVG
ncbi:hypothetical protein F0U62_18125 [Cystobacter fuscus]|uniref:NAD(P)/FAD-dependent oxidoreductase n=1 Tax=Cystobacter fuscus TaxID=43 RepID=UPI002B29B080|nr:hypothetical protein F0U62_18125 [Cystobacter fuscus]